MPDIGAKSSQNTQQTITQRESQGASLSGTGTVQPGGIAAALKRKLAHQVDHFHENKKVENIEIVLIPKLTYQLEQVEKSFQMRLQAIEQKHSSGQAEMTAYL